MLVPEFIEIQVCEQLQAKAKTLLTDKEVKDVAGLLGLRVTTFIVFFRTYSGITPREFKIQLLKGKL
jgi:AraC-like DNA-binding protein